MTHTQAYVQGMHNGWPTISGLSDSEAMGIGRCLARTISDHEHVLVTLNNGTTKILSHCTLTDRVFIGTLS